jgi:hypothetical protein
MNYEYKYMKYKIKYNELKNSMIGGTKKIYNLDENTINKIRLLLSNKQIDSEIPRAFDSLKVYALKRDKYTNDILKKYDIEILDEENDISLISFDKMVKSDGSAYTIYGAFYKNAIKTDVKQPIKNNYKKYSLLKNLTNYRYKINDLKLMR